jgi:hypothetical protein
VGRVAGQAPLFVAHGCIPKVRVEAVGLASAGQMVTCAVETIHDTPYSVVTGPKVLSLTTHRRLPQTFPLAPGNILEVVQDRGFEVGLGSSRIPFVFFF